jgi:ribosome recycling factor
MSADEWEKGPTEESMKKVVESLKTELGSVRVGRAEPSFLANVVVEGKPISKWGQIQVKDAGTLTVTLFDPANIPKLAKGLEESELKLNATSDGRVVVVPIPRFAVSPLPHISTRLLKFRPLVQPRS